MVREPVEVAQCFRTEAARRGGSAELHLARAVVRRAERAAVAAAEAGGFSAEALRYLNRLSDHLFVLARWVARERGGDILWQPGATRG